MAQGDLCSGPGRCPLARPGTPVARCLSRAAARDSVRQRHRARSAFARRDVRGRPIRSGLPGLFADLAGLRKAAPCFRVVDARTCVRIGRQGVRTCDRSRDASGNGSDCHAQSGGRPQVGALRGAARDQAGLRPRCGACKGRSGHDREGAVHFRLDRNAEGRDQHPADVVLEPKDGPESASLLRGRAAGDPRLVPLASHRERQSQLRLHRLQRRHLLHR